MFTFVIVICVRFRCCYLCSHSSAFVTTTSVHLHYYYQCPPSLLATAVHVRLRSPSLPLPVSAFVTAVRVRVHFCSCPGLSRLSFHQFLPNPALLRHLTHQDMSLPLSKARSPHGCFLQPWRVLPRNPLRVLRTCPQEPRPEPSQHS